MGFLKYVQHGIIYAVHFMANVVHPSVAPDVRWWHMQYTWLQMQYTQVRLLMYMMASAGHLMVNPVHLLASAVHPSEAPDEHDRICSTLDCKCSTPKWGSWCTVHMIVSTVHLMANAVHQVGLLKYSMASAVHLMANTEHPSEAPDVHDGLYSSLDGKSSAPAGKCSTPKWGSWWTW